MNQPDETQKEASGAIGGIQSAGENLGYNLTPASVDTQPTPADLLEAAAAYIQAVFGLGSEIKSFRKTSEQPVIWQAQVLRGDRLSVLNARRVPGGYKFSVEK